MNVVILEPLGVAKEKLLGLGREVLGDQVNLIYYDTRTEDVDELIERSKDADVVVLSNFQYRREVMEHCEHLKMVCVAFTGVDHVDMEYCREHDIMVCNCAGYSTVAVADLVFGFVIDLMRNILPCNEAVRAEGTKAGLVGCELAGKKFGVIGTGAIGMRTAKIADAFGCEVYGYSRTVKDVDYIKYVDLKELMELCDIISLHVPLNENTKGMIGAQELSYMKESAILINTARGPVVDAQALADALNEGKIAGAGIDVFEMEPPVPKDHPLLQAKNVVATPHIAFATKEAFEKRSVIVFDNIKKWMDGNPQNVM
jgi:phosphoglycerate dehydrogenase-like enzyme